MKINKVKTDLASYPHYIIIGVPKSGKTTFFRDLVLYLYPNHPEKGLLISCMDENGYISLDEINVEATSDWSKFPETRTGFDGEEEIYRGLVEIVDEVIARKGTSEQIELVALDTWDELIRMAEAQVFEEHREIKGSYPKSMNQALEGYQAGQKRVVELIQQQLRRLNEAHVAVFLLGHTKVKEKKNVMNPDEIYDYYTSNLMTTYYTPIASTAQMIVNFVMEQKIEGSEIIKKKVNGKEVIEHKAGKVVGVNRMMYFGDNFFVDCSSRFTGLPSKLPLSAENFMKAFNQGVKNSLIKKNLTEEQIKQQHQEEKINADKKGLEYKEQEEKKKLLIKLQSLTNMDNKDIVMNFLNKHSIKKMEQLTSKQVLEIIEILSEKVEE